jgi:ketosteroid isomerase-like protein
MIRIFTLLLLVSSTAIFSADNNNIDETEVSQVLNALHEKASSADFNGYFDLYSTDAVFIGTDAHEVWSIDDFKAYAKPHFDKGTGWTYLPRDRHIYFSPNAQVAWFDELLDNKKLGETRGTGVLIKTDGTWKVSQYHLAIPIPNNLASSVALQIKKQAKK